MLKMRSICVIVFIFLVYIIFIPQVLAASIVISGGQESISPNDEYNVNIKFFINNSQSTDYYLRGVFYKPNINHYCGYTWNGSSWFKGPYSSNNEWTNFLKISIQNNSWSGILKAKFDFSESECHASGEYKFKIERFTKRGTGDFDTQNEQTVHVLIPTPTSIFTLTPSLTPTPVPTSQIIISPEILISTVLNPSPTEILIPTQVYDQNSNLSLEPTTAPNTPTHIAESLSNDIPTEEIFSPTIKASAENLSLPLKIHSVNSSISAVLGFNIQSASADSNIKLKKIKTNHKIKRVLPISIVSPIIAGGVLLLIGCGILISGKTRSRIVE